MSKKNLVFIIIAIILIIVGIIFIINNKNNNADNTISNTKQVEETQNPIVEKKTNGTYEIYNTNLSNDNGTTKINAIIENVSKSTTPEQFIDIVLLDKSNNELGIIKVAVPSLKSGEATEISAESLKIYQDIYNFKIK